MSSTMSFRLSSWPLGGHPHAHLKADTPCGALIPVPMMKTPVPTTMNQCSTRSETTQRAPTFKIMVKRVYCAAHGALHQHQSDFPPKQPSWSRNIPLVRINTVTLGQTVGLQDCSGVTCSLSEETQAPQRQQLVPPATRHEHS